MKYCQGPDCHTYDTMDRIRGPKGDKHYETRRRTNLGYGNNFCSLICQDDWFRKFGERAVDHFGRTTEAKRLVPDNAWRKDYDWDYNNGNGVRIDGNSLLSGRSCATFGANPSTVLAPAADRCARAQAKA